MGDDRTDRAAGARRRNGLEEFGISPGDLPSRSSIADVARRAAKGLQHQPMAQPKTPKRPQVRARKKSRVHL
jgi:hypothetical protein